MSTNLKLENLSFRYHTESALLFTDLNAQFEKGSITAITGPNGSGKTTLLYAMCGIIPKIFKGLFGGKVIYAGNELSNFTLPQVSQWMNLLQQDPDHQLVFPVVEQELAFGAENLCIPAKEIEKRISQTLSSLDLEDLRYANTAELSYGQKKLISLASLLVMDGQVLLLDEPSAGLDEKAVSLPKKLLLSLSEQGKIIIMAEHIQELLSISHQQIRMPYQVNNHVI